MIHDSRWLDSIWKRGFKSKNGLAIAYQITVVSEKGEDLFSFLEWHGYIQDIKYVFDLAYFHLKKVVFLDKVWAMKNRTNSEIGYLNKIYDFHSIIMTLGQNY